MSRSVTVWVSVPVRDDKAEPNHARFAVKEMIDSYTIKGWSPDSRFDWANVAISAEEYEPEHKTPR